MIELHLQATDGKGLHVGIKFEFKTENDLRRALQYAVPHLNIHGIATVYLNTLQWNFGIAKVEQNEMKSRHERYDKTGN